MTTRLARFAVLFALAGIPVGPVVAAETQTASLPAILEECSTLSLAAEGRRVKDKSAKIGHLEITLNEGVATPIRGKSGQTLGFYVEGNGGYRYTVESAEDRASFAANVAHVAKTLRAVDNGLNDRFTKMLVLFSEPVMTEIWDAASGGESAAAPSAKSGFSDLLRGALTSYPEFDFRTALARMNGTGRYVYVELKGELEQVGYALDDLVSGRERLFTFRKLPDYDARVTETLSFQAVQGWTLDRETWLTLTRADIAMETADNKRGSIVSDVAFHVRGAGARLLSLALDNNGDPDSALWTSNVNKLTVKRVTGTNGADLPFAHRYDELLVEIPPAQSAESDVTIHVDTEGELFLDINGRHADNYFIFLERGWYPTTLGFHPPRLSYSLKVKTKKPWRPVTSGKEISIRDEGDSFVASSSGENAPPLITVLAGKYVTRAETIDGLTVRVHAYASARKNVIENLPKLSAGIVKFYTGMLGAMPAEELDVVEIPEYGFGVSPSGVILLTSEAYKAREEEIAEYLSRGINARLAHEIAHQWFYHKAQPRDPSEGWISESFAEYFAGIFMGSIAGTDKTIVGFDRMLAEWRADAKYCADVAPISMASYLGGESGWKDRRCLLYSRGPLVLHMLRTSIGNEKFFGATKKFLDTANIGPVGTDDYAKAVSDFVQMDMGWYFDQWIRRAGNAQVDVEQHLDVAANGLYKLWGTMRQAPGAGFKKLLVPLVWDKNGTPDARVVFVDQPEKKFEFLIPFKPGSIKPDPFQNNLAVYR